MAIHGKMTVVEVLKYSKDTRKVFAKHKLDCPGCKGAVEDTIEKVAENNGLDCNAFLEELVRAAAGNK